ncbi:hypothetical protein NPIL_628721 [Nephila pilipes]|uniref:Uncharacterized protein n=1 Tax=Nephila pilipes TaxID=299642 RepID=A0A8X6UJF2_NEPPI|nr:hypothetical protein NPIL_628721 [Nephila pilipes]
MSYLAPKLVNPYQNTPLVRILKIRLGDSKVIVVYMVERLELVNISGKEYYRSSSIRRETTKGIFLWKGEVVIKNFGCKSATMTTRPLRRIGARGC